MTSVLTAFDTCKRQFTDLKSQLKELDESWRSLSGAGRKDRVNNTESSRDQRSRTGTSRNDLLNARKRPQHRSLASRREHAGRPSIRSRLSYNDSKDDHIDDKDIPKPSLSSTVVTTGALNLSRISSGLPGSRPNNSNSDRTNREDFIDEQRKTSDSNIMKRHKRMFGMIIGTLARFQSEESARKGVVEKRREVERKVEETEKEAATRLADERRRVMLERRAKRAELRKTQLKLDRLEAHQQWEASHSKVTEFIQTRSKPALCWLPKRLDPITEKKLKESKDKNKLIVAERRAKLQKELADIDALYERDRESKDDQMDLDEDDEDMDQDEGDLETSHKTNSGPAIKSTISIPSKKPASSSGESGQRRTSDTNGSAKKEDTAQMELGEVD